MAVKPAVKAVGGIFFRSKNPEATRKWYQQHLGLHTDAYGTSFAWRQDQNPEKNGYTQWSPFDEETAYFGERDQQFMVNYRVDELETLVSTLLENGVQVVGEIKHEPYGKFVHIVDGDGRRVELWEPVDSEYEKMLDGVTR